MVQYNKEMGFMFFWNDKTYTMKGNDVIDVYKHCAECQPTATVNKGNVPRYRCTVADVYRQPSFTGDYRLGTESKKRKVGGL